MGFVDDFDRILKNSSLGVSVDAVPHALRVKRRVVGLVDILKARYAVVDDRCPRIGVCVRKGISPGSFPPDTADELLCERVHFHGFSSLL